MDRAMDGWAEVWCVQQSREVVRAGDGCPQDALACADFLELTPLQAAGNIDGVRGRECE